MVMVDQIKKALFNKVSPDALQKMLDDLRPCIQWNDTWTLALQRQKASLIGNAESAAR